MKEREELNKKIIQLPEEEMVTVEATKLTQVSGGVNIPPGENSDNIAPYIPPCIDGINNNGVYIGVNYLNSSNQVFTA